jgi:acetyltransferase-like isoleucine patch superfamily enzyme
MRSALVRELSGPRGVAVRAVFAARRRWYSLRYPNLELGDGVMFVGRLRLKSGTRLVLGDRVRVRKLVRVNGGGTVRVGSDTLLNGCWIIAAREVTIGDRCLISNAGIMDNDFHNLPPALRHDPPNELTRAPVTIGDNVWVGASALVLKGVHIGHDSAVGAAAVVRDDVPERCVVSGNPAQVVKHFKSD